VLLGPLRVGIRSNELPFAELRYFPESTRLPPQSPVDFTIHCYNLTLDGPWPVQALEEIRDRSYRGTRLAAGYYLTDHFGPPAYLVTRARDLWIFAPRFDQILWPFVVKYLLTVHSIDRQMLHLKAAAVALRGNATLLVGRGGSGKTVLLTQLCRQAGAQFLSNTHVLVSEATLIPVASTMRVRNDSLFGPDIRAGRLPTAIKAGEFLADPGADLGWTVGTECPLLNICLLDYRGGGQRKICELHRDILFDYMENFSLALSIYGLKEDLLDYLGGDVTRFSIEWSHAKGRLRELVDRCRCYYVSGDVTHPQTLQTIAAMLSEVSGK
jgi:hypothetical protein